MKTQIKKRATSLVIVLTKEFLKYMELKEGDWVDIADIHKVKKEDGATEYVN